MSLELRYFVLKPRGLSRYAQASREAMRAYAYEIMDDDDIFARELIEWADKEQEAADSA